jgi:hypothetical protein
MNFQYRRRPDAKHYNRTCPRLRSRPENPINLGVGRPNRWINPPFKKEGQSASAFTNDDELYSMLPRQNSERVAYPSADAATKTSMAEKPPCI